MKIQISYINNALKKSDYFNNKKRKRENINNNINKKIKN